MKLTKPSDEIFGGGGAGGSRAETPEQKNRRRRGWNRKVKAFGRRSQHKKVSLAMRKASEIFGKWIREAADYTGVDRKFLTALIANWLLRHSGDRKLPFRGLGTVRDVDGKKIDTSTINGNILAGAIKAMKDYNKHGNTRKVMRLLGYPGAGEFYKAKGSLITKKSQFELSKNIQKETGLSKGEWNQTFQHINDIVVSLLHRRVTKKEAVHMINRGWTDHTIQRVILHSQEFRESKEYKRRKDNVLQIIASVYGADYPIDKQMNRLARLAVIDDWGEDDIKSYIRNRPDYQNSEEFQRNRSTLQGVWDKLVGHDLGGRAASILDNATRDEWSEDQLTEYIRSQPWFNTTATFQNHKLQLADFLYQNFGITVLPSTAPEQDVANTKSQWTLPEYKPPTPIPDPQPPNIPEMPDITREDIGLPPLKSEGPHVKSVGETVTEPYKVKKKLYPSKWGMHSKEWIRTRRRIERRRRRRRRRRRHR